MKKLKQELKLLLASLLIYWAICLVSKGETEEELALLKHLLLKKDEEEKDKI